MKAIDKKRQEAIDTLRTQFNLKPGDTIFCSLRHVSRSGMYRCIDLFVMRDNEPLRISWTAAQLLEGYDKRHEGCKASGCGMDMGFHLVMNLGYSLFPDGFDCVGKDCPSNDHSNSYSDTTNKFNGTKFGNCLICHAELQKKAEYYRKHNGHKWQVCSQACASATWHHSSGGYAFRQRWL